MLSLALVLGPWLSLRIKFQSFVLSLALRLESLVLALALRVKSLVMALALKVQFLPRATSKTKAKDNTTETITYLIL